MTCNPHYIDSIIYNEFHNPKLELEHIRKEFTCLNYNNVLENNYILGGNIKEMDYKKKYMKYKKNI